MPQLFSSNLTALPFHARFPPARGKRNLLIGAGIVAAALVAGGLASAWVAALAVKPGANPGAGLEGTSLEHLDLSRFQQRGNLLVGETTAPSGARLRLVLDARSRQLVGLRVITEEGPGRHSARMARFPPLDHAP